MVWIVLELVVVRDSLLYNVSAKVQVFFEIGKFFKVRCNKKNKRGRQSSFTYIDVIKC